MVSLIEKEIENKSLASIFNNTLIQTVELMNNKNKKNPIKHLENGWSGERNRHTFLPLQP